MLMGVETEYAVAGPGKHGEAAHALVREARSRLAHLPGHPAGIFLANGARLYMDTGSHPEYCTPECAHPSEAVRHVLAGERILEDLVARDAAGQRRAREAIVFKHNVDPVLRTTWACHESYLVRHPPAHFVTDLPAHLVSRIVFCGAGGLHPASRGFEFTLSPRAWFLERTVTDGSTQNRGILHLKDETLSRAGHHRLHLLCGESLCSEIAAWLKLGTTALVVALLDAGVSPGPKARPYDPVAALREFALDPACRVRVPMEAGAPASAVEIQRRLLGLVEANADTAGLPDWAPEVCREWGAMLDRVEAGPEAVSRTVDWAIKHGLFIRHAERRGLPWASLGRLGRAIARPAPAPEDADAPGFEPAPELFPTLFPEPRRTSPGASRERLRAAVALRHELCEIETRFGELSERGIFRSLDEAGQLDHRAPGIGDVAQACEHPPAHGRARTRGAAVRAHAGASGFQCDWQAVWDVEGKRLLDLGDPFASEAEWKQCARTDWIARALGMV